MGNEYSCHCECPSPFDDDLNAERTAKRVAFSKDTSISRAAHRGLEDAAKAQFDELRHRTVWGAVDLVPGFEYKFPLLEPDFYLSDDSWKRFCQYVRGFEGWRASRSEAADQERIKYNVTHQNNAYFVTVKYTVPDDPASMLLDEPPLLEQMTVANLSSTSSSGETPTGEQPSSNKWHEMTRDTFLDEWDNRSLEMSKVRSLKNAKDYANTFVQPTLVQPNSTASALATSHSGFLGKLVQPKADSVNHSTPFPLRKTPGLVKLTPESSLDDSIDSLGLRHPMDESPKYRVQPPPQHGPTVVSASAVFPAALKYKDDNGTKTTGRSLGKYNGTPTLVHPTSVEARMTEVVCYGDMMQVQAFDESNPNSLIDQTLSQSMDSSPSPFRAHSK